MCESISDRNSFQSSNGTIVVLGFSKNLLSNRWGIFSSVALSENVERMIRFEFELVETSCRCSKQFFESIIKIISNASHVSAVYFWNCVNVLVWLFHIKRFIGITEPSTDRLVNKNNVVILGPTIIIFFYIVRLHVSSRQSEGSQLKQITELTWGTRTSIQPENYWVLSYLALCSVLSSVKHKGEDWVSFVNI